LIVNTVKKHEKQNISVDIDTFISKIKLYKVNYDNKQEKKAEIFSALFSYVNENSKHSFKGEELLLEDDKLLGVSILYLLYFKYI
jgi:hypothetical protein